MLKLSFPNIVVFMFQINKKILIFYIYFFINKLNKFYLDIIKLYKNNYRNLEFRNSKF